MSKKKIKEDTKQKKIVVDSQGKKDKYCTLCEKPHKSRTQMCGACNKKAIELTGKMGLQFKVSINRLLYVKKQYNADDIFALLDKKPQLLFTKSDRGERLALKRSARETHRSEEYQKEKYIKWECEIPSYIYNELKKHPTKRFTTLSGDKRNPNVHYICIACGEEQVQKYSDLASGKGHSCIATKSSGEIVVEDYLRKKYNIKTQRDTLKCINPITKYVMPYDIEIPELKIIIEIQGDQHIKYIEYFHGTIENFYYQKRKDSYKKAYAEKKGYKMIYIYYDEIKNGTYVEKLNF